MMVVLNLGFLKRPTFGTIGPAPRIYLGIYYRHGRTVMLSQAVEALRESVPSAEFPVLDLL